MDHRGKSSEVLHKAHKVTGTQFGCRQLTWRKSSGGKKKSSVEQRASLLLLHCAMVILKCV